MSDLLGLTAAQQAELIASGEVSGTEVFEFWRERAAGEAQQEDLPAQLPVAGVGGERLVEAVGGPGVLAGFQREPADEVAAGRAAAVDRRAAAVRV